MYDLCITPTMDKILEKLIKRNKDLLTIVHNKIEEIRNNPFHRYKHLKRPL